MTAIELRTIQTVLLQPRTVDLDVVNVHTNLLSSPHYQGPLPSPVQYIECAVARYDRGVTPSQIFMTLISLIC